MTRRRHAEIVGAGFSGLTAAAALASRGWTVRVHERGPEIRAHGSALSLAENGLRVLEAVGAYDDAVLGAFRLRYRETRDRADRLVAFYDWTSEDHSLRQFMLLRKRVIEALAKAARTAGAEIVTGSEAVSATPDGEVVLASGARLRADLVVAADGVNSRLRETLGLLKRRRRLADGSIRMLLPIRREVAWRDGVFAEYWSGRRRCFVVPCSEEDFYLGFVALERDEAGKRVPIDKTTWIEAFPPLAPFIERVGDQRRWSWDQYEAVVLHRWSRGRVAVLGDAAHAMSPNFGQGGALAMGSALSLAALVDEHRTLAAALGAWEARERPIVERTQRLSGLYSTFMSWPEWPRRAALTMMARSRWVMRQRTLASYHRPAGTA